MKTFHLLGQTYEIPVSSEKFLSDYISRIEKYVARNNIDTEYLDDIKSRIIERLDAIENPIKQSDIINVVNDLGEGEDIFADIDNKIPQDTSTQKPKNIWLWRKKKILFGVALRLSEGLNIPVLYIRIIFLLLACIAGVGIWLYLGLVILLPGIFTFSSENTATQSFLGVIIRKLITWIKVIGKWGIAFFILIIACIFLIWGVIGSIGWINLFEQWIISGQDILSVVTPTIRIAIIVWSISMLLIALGLTTFVFHKSIFWRYSWSILVLTLIWSGIVIVSTLPPIIRDFAMTYEKDIKISDLGTIETWEIVIELDKQSGTDMSWNFSNFSIEYDNTATGIIVEVETRLRGQWAVESRLSQMRQLDIVRVDNTVKITAPRDIFREVVPLTLIEYRIKIRAPKNILIKNSYGSTYNTYRTELEDYTPGRHECEYSRFIYDDVRGLFFCDPSGYTQEILDDLMRTYAEQYQYRDGDDTVVRKIENIVASGSYTVQKYDRKDGEMKGIPIEVYINKNGDIWSLER